MGTVEGLKRGENSLLRLSRFPTWISVWDRS